MGLQKDCASQLEDLLELIEKTNEELTLETAKNNGKTFIDILEQQAASQGKLRSFIENKTTEIPVSITEKSKKKCVMVSYKTISNLIELEDTRN